MEVEYQCQAYNDQGQWDRSIELPRRLIERAPTQTNGLVALGVALLQANKTGEGINELQGAISQ